VRLVTGRCSMVGEEGSAVTIDRNTGDAAHRFEVRRQCPETLWQSRRDEWNAIVHDVGRWGSWIAFREIGYRPEVEKSFDL